MYVCTADLAGVRRVHLAGDGGGREHLADGGGGREHLADGGAGREHLVDDGAGREHLEGDGAGRERAWVARARLRGLVRAPLRPWRLLRRARAAMGLLRLLALAVLASQPGVAGGAETIGNSSVGKIGGASRLQPKLLLHFL